MSFATFTCLCLFSAVLAYPKVDFLSVHNMVANNIHTIGFHVLEENFLSVVLPEEPRRFSSRSPGPDRLWPYLLHLSHRPSPNPIIMAKGVGFAD